VASLAVTPAPARATSAPLLSVRGLVVWLTIASLFAGGLKATVGFDLRLSYLFVAIGFASLLLLTPRLRIPIGPVAVLWSYLMLCAAFMFLHNSALLIPRTLPQIVGIGFFATYFLLFIANAGLSAEALFQAYVKMAVWVALLGFPILVLTGLTDGFWRLKSIFAEPAHYATAMMPAVGYAVATARSHPWRCAVLLLAMVLTLSLTGYIGLGLVFALVAGRSWWVRILMAAFALALLVLAYSASPEIRKRIDDTARVAQTADFTGANLSTYALLSNYWVAYSSFQESPVFGGGLGSHPESHDRFIGQLEGLELFDAYLEQNKEDANSLFVRTLSEQGIVGLFLLGLFILRYRKAVTPSQQAINNAILVYFALKLIREGHYFTPEFFFMTTIYYCNGAAFRNRALP